VNAYLSEPGGFIPMEEFKEIKKECDEEEKEFILDVYKYKIWKNTIRNAGINNIPK
jgi:hypothetical protein